MSSIQGLSRKRTIFWWKAWLVGTFFVTAILFPSYLLLKDYLSEPREAPEAERVLSAQVGMPFQVLIPAYLPGIFKREQMEIITDQPGPQGEAMIQLIYSTRQGNTLVLSEWIPRDQASNQTGLNAQRCICICRSSTQCDLLGVEFNVGLVRVRFELSAANLLSHDQMEFVQTTLGPAVNRQIYSSMEEVPVSYSVPPAVDIPVNADGVQELTLVVTPEGYSPVHFAVKKGVPVRLIFRQLGEVGCGDELVVQWGAGKSATLKLASPGDKQVLEFTPGQAGEFRIHCPHEIYRGVMTVKD